MAEGVNAWRQSGEIHVWRYSAPGRSRWGWHFGADPAGCASIADLIDRMMATNVVCHRTFSLGQVSADIWSVPNFGPPKSERFEKLQVDYLPDATDLMLVVNDDRLTLAIGAARAGILKAAFVDFGIGGGDFGIATSTRKNAETWMFWWMPRINYYDRKKQ